MSALARHVEAFSSRESGSTGSVCSLARSTGGTYCTYMNEDPSAKPHESVRLSRSIYIYTASTPFSFSFVTTGLTPRMDITLLEATMWSWEEGEPHAFFSGPRAAVAQQETGRYVHTKYLLTKILVCIQRLHVARGFVFRAGYWYPFP